jgi:hypothetical protein
MSGNHKLKDKWRWNICPNGVKLVAGVWYRGYGPLQQDNGMEPVSVVEASSGQILLVSGSR